MVSIKNVQQRSSQKKIHTKQTNEGNSKVWKMVCH